MFVLVFGGINQKAALRRAKYAFDLKEFSKELESKVEAIPNEKRMDPNVHTVCTALDNMRYCVEEPELRQMFSSLIANSLNSDTCEKVHPSYGEIIKQLTGFDASLIIWMKGRMGVPTIRFHIEHKEKDELIQIPLIYIDYGTDAFDKLQVSLENLSRLKIIDLKLNETYADRSIYDEVKKTERYLKDKEEFEKEAGSVYDGYGKIEETYGSIEITQFGRKFIEACC